MDVIQGRVHVPTNRLISRRAWFELLASKASLTIGRTSSSLERGLLDRAQSGETRGGWDDASLLLPDLRTKVSKRRQEDRSCTNMDRSVVSLAHHVRRLTLEPGPAGQ